MEDVVLQAMRNAGEPVNATRIAEMTHLDRSVVDKAMKSLKDAGQISSPKRCYWQPAAQ